jgi:toxin ParE1/3/4
MSRFVLSPRARDDLDGVWDHTARGWGSDQAERYLRRIAEAVGLIAEAPTIGRNCDHVRQGYRKYPVGSHVLFYREIDDGVDVVRILHQRMDFDRHLP